MEWSEIEEAFAEIDKVCTELAKAKNHDYGNAWIHFRISTLLEIMLSKILRAINLNDLGPGKALVPDKITDELKDIINWSRFTLMQLKNEGKL